jgi:hypothetical protein
MVGGEIPSPSLTKAAHETATGHRLHGGKHNLHNYILGDDGEPVGPVDILVWAEWYETHDRFIAKTKVGDALVSTVFLGIDHAFGGGPPLLFETMVFGGEHDQSQWRHYNRYAALAFHDQVVAALRDGAPLPN